MQRRQRLFSISSSPPFRVESSNDAISRRRPWKVARECVTVDRLSNGRLTFTVGMGAAKDDSGFNKVGEAMDLKIRAQRVDEGLEIIDGLWKAKPFSFAGEHFHVDN